MSDPVRGLSHWIHNCGGYAHLNPHWINALTVSVAAICCLSKNCLSWVIGSHKAPQEASHWDGGKSNWNNTVEV